MRKLHTRSGIAVALLMTALIAGCAPGKEMTETQLYFGMSIKDKPAVSDEQWKQFVDEVVAPRFPDGFTVTAAEGQWRGPDGKVVHEPSRVLTVLRTPGPENNVKLEEIRAEYKQRFHQDSVMRVDDYARVQF